MRSTPVQAKLLVGSGSDPAEMEADRVADELVTPGSSKCSCGSTCSTCSSPSASGVVRRAPLAHAQPETSVPDHFLSALGAGESLDLATRARFEPGLGRDLSDVRVHTGEAASHAAASIQARAFTAGRDVVFGAGQYDPHSEASRRVLAHELAHVAQQGDGAGPPVIRRVGAHDPPMGYFPAERELMERQRAAERAEAEKHQRWVQSHKRTSGSALKSQATSLAADMASTQDMLVEQRMAVLRDAQTQSAQTASNALPSMYGMGQPLSPQVIVPADLAAKWALAHQEAAVVEPLLKGKVFTPEAAAVARAAFGDYYRSLEILTASSDAGDLDLQRMSERFAPKKKPPNPCPTCHTANEPPSFFQGYVAPPPSTPAIRTALGLVELAATDAEWESVLSGFAAATRTMDRLLLATIPADSPSAQGFTYAQELLERQQTLQGEIERTGVTAVKIRAVFYPKDKWIETGGDGKKQEIAQGIPWFFFLTYPPVGANNNYPDGFSWKLRDITSPLRPEVSYKPSDVERFVRSFHAVGPTQVPRYLFEELNNTLIFPEGVLYWVNPDGTSDSITTTEPTSLSEWLGRIGMAIGALAIILGTAGLATPGVLAGLTVLGAAAGIGSTLADLNERSELGILTKEDKDKAALYIAADLASALTAGLGRAAAGAARTATAAGRASRLTFVVQRAAQGANIVDKGLGATVMITVTAELVQQYEAIQNSGLPPADRERALQRLALTGLLTGAMVAAPHAAGGVKQGPHAPAAHGPHADAGGLHSSAGATDDVLTVTRGAGEPQLGWGRPHGDADFLGRTKGQDQLRPGDAAHELQIAREQAIKKPLPHDPEYSNQIEANGHTWREMRNGRGWCRFSTKVCYPNAQLRVGAGGDAERVTEMKTAADVAQFRANDLAKPPRPLRSDQARLDWADYRFYADRRLKAIDTALAEGRAPPTPPRTFASFQQEHPPGSVVRNEIQGARFEQRTAGVVNEVVDPSRRDVVLSQAYLSESTNPAWGTKGEVTRADFLYPSGDRTGWTAVSNKSRSSLVGMTDAQAEAVVVRDLEEAVAKYTGVLQLQAARTATGATWTSAGGPQEVSVTRVRLLYDGAMVPQKLQGVIRAKAREFQRVYADTGLVIEVGIF